MLPAERGQPNPPRRENAQNVSVREQHDIAVDGARPDDHSVDPCSHLLRPLSSRASVSKDEPAWRDVMNLLRRQSLVVAIVPLDQISVDDRHITEACQFAGLSRASHWAAKSEPECIPGQDRLQPLRQPTAVVGQRHVSRSSVPTIEAPSCLAVSDHENVHVRLLEHQTSRLSGPLIDRFDLVIDVPSVSAADLMAPAPREGSAEVAARVAAARTIQLVRYSGLGLEGVACNAAAPASLIEEIAEADASGLRLLPDAAERLRLSARGYHRVLKLARTLADLDGEGSVKRAHLAEALSYRGAPDRAAAAA